MNRRRGFEPFPLRLLILAALLLCGLLPLANRPSPANHTPVQGFRTQTFAMTAPDSSDAH